MSHPVRIAANDPALRAGELPPLSELSHKRCSPCCRRDAEASSAQPITSPHPLPYGEHMPKVLGQFLLVFNFHLLRKQIYIFNKHQTKCNKILKQILVNSNISQCLTLPERRFQGRQEEHPSAATAVLFWQLLPHSYSNKCDTYYSPVSQKSSTGNV